MRNIAITAALAFGSLGSFASAATVLIDFGGEFAAGTQDSVLSGGTVNGTTRTHEYNTTTALTAGLGNYTGLPFYGAVQIQNSVTAQTITMRAQSNNSPTTDYLRALSTFPSESETGSASGLLFIKKSDFLAPGTVSFDTSSSASLQFNNVNAQANSARKVRLAVLNGGQWYLSSSSSSSGSATLSIADLATETWGAWTATGAPLSAAPATFTTLGSTLTDIQGFGVWYSASYTTPSAGTGTRTMGIGLINLDLSAVVPEPASLSLVGLAGSVLLGRRARGSRCS